MTRKLLRYTIVVALGYVPLGMTFGILFNQTGYSIWYAIVMSVCVFAGSAQFLAVTLMLNQTPLLTVFLLTLILNLRHLFYAFHTYDLYRKISWPRRLYMMFALTDETFAIISTLSGETQGNHKLLFHLSLFNHFWWVLGSTIGAVLGNFVDIHIKGLEFVMVSFFVVLLVEQFYQSNKTLSVVLGVISAMLSLIFFGGENFLMIGLAFCLTLFSVYKMYGRLASR